ncbi:MAG: class I SAM-dependent methyltransferase [Pyrinomonadaceae bacterium]
MTISKIEKEWERYGAENAYYTVLTDEKYRAENLDEKMLDDFFDSGENHVQRIWHEIESSLVSQFSPRRGLDFGCGVGRLTLPLAAKCGEVVGVDISANMVTEAEQNRARKNVVNASFVKDDGTFSNVSGSFDFIHSFIVFQHIEPALGQDIARRLIEKLEIGGIGVLQFVYRDKTPPLTQLRVRLYRDYWFIRALRNFVLQAKTESVASIFPMNTYNLNNLFAILQENDCHRCAVRFSDHHFDGVVLFFQKGREALY